MQSGTLKIYSASAGSGKTYTLTGIYLRSLLQSRYSYRKILAVTFTNKATAEMKLRILQNLYKLSSGQACDYLNELTSEKHPEEWVRREAGEILNCILHDFSRFSVMTIDSFFQKVIRAFAKEAGLNAGFSIELDHQLLLSAAVDQMISTASGDKQLKNWLSDFALNNIDEEKTWNLRDASMKLAQELFNEKFKVLSRDEILKLSDKEFLSGYIKKLKAIKSGFETRLRDYGQKGETYFSTYNLSDDFFYQKSKGIPRYIRQLSKGIVEEGNCYVRGVVSPEPKWCTGKMHPSLQSAISAGFGELIRDAIMYYDENNVNYHTAVVILDNIYALGILTDILKQLRIITNSVNSFLLSDAGELLYRIIEKDQCPFVYEKIGNRYENFMIDEFQDTSVIQWSNFMPLIENSSSQGFDNLVVGDIKQSIYRWRNSDLTILRDIPLKDCESFRVTSEPLATNYRSSENIIRFNNAVFSALPVILDEKLAEENLHDKFSTMYSEAVQQDPGKNKGGYVRIEFVDCVEEESWQQEVVNKIPSLIASILQDGYSASDIGIIVRESREGAMVLRKLIDYASKPENEKSSFRFISDDSLLLSGSAAVNLIISSLRYINNPSDNISEAAMFRFFMSACNAGSSDDILPLSEEAGAHLPAGLHDFLLSLTSLPLFETTEKITGFFGIGNYPWNVPYLSSFQDAVLNFTTGGNTGISSFLDWWDTSGCRKSVVLPGNQDAVRILTIHKSKGLEFPVVILPFISWNLDHSTSHQPLLWVRPREAPFDEPGIVPVKCSKELKSTILSEHYYNEKFLVHLDNLNLLYVAFTRAKKALYGFSELKTRQCSVSSILKDALTSEKDYSGFCFSERYEKSMNLFEFGHQETKVNALFKNPDIFISGYEVRELSHQLKLKLHGENYFSPSAEEVRKKISYGKIMHEVFEGIDTVDDVSSSILKLVMEGKISASESSQLETRIKKLLDNEPVRGWFSPGATVLKESGIILTSGNIRRPDRVIIKDGIAIVVDFKFGEEKEDHIMQTELYRSLLADMGYRDTKGFVWYVDSNKIVETSC